MAVAGLDLLGKTGNLLHKALGGESLRFQVRAHNYANANTPAYKRQDVEFEDYLANSLDRTSGFVGLRKTHPRHLDGERIGATPRIVQDNTSTMRYDRNNVDIEQEMVALTETAIRYQVLAEQLTKQIRQLRTVISERVG
jgi:flagellar basal-body rod protein FlgB